MAARRKLNAVDDPLAAGGPAQQPQRATTPAPASATVPVYVKLPLAQSDALARAAFELRATKRELVGALIAAYVEPASPEGLGALRKLVSQYRRVSR